MSFSLPIEILFPQIGMPALQHQLEESELIVGGQLRHRNERERRRRFGIMEERHAFFATVFATFPCTDEVYRGSRVGCV